MAAAGQSREPVDLDGSFGEGGGQILRSALSLSLVTGRPFRLRNIRAMRKPPGLRPQHLACVRGAEAISASHSEGARVGAPELFFTPGPVRPGEYLVEVGTAGSTPLLFQCLFFPLALAGGGQLVLRGGTHVPKSPSYHYLAWVWAPVMSAFGLHASLQLRHAGFYPKGGGEFRGGVEKSAEPPTLVDLPARGTLTEVRVTSFVAGLPLSIAERQGASAVSALRERGIHCDSENLPLPTNRSQGTAVFIRAYFENTLAGFSALGERGKPAEVVGREAAEELARFMESGGSIDQHLGDQLLMPAALLAAGLLGPSSPGTSRYVAAEVTAHLTTHAWLLQQFLPVTIEVSAGGEVKVAPRAGN
ncbi:MAG: RNA 3'-terminal phosphate cyclase [Myxococcaceae bacterium]